MKLRVSLILVSLFILSKQLEAQRPELKFKHITTLDGLSNSFARTLTQDHRGFIWINTTNGLNKYDGYEVIIYKNSADDPYSLRSNNTTYIYEDNDSNLWIGTNEGIDLYNRKLDNFIHYNETEGEYITGAFTDHSKVLWFAGLGCVFRFDKSENKFKKLTFDGLTATVNYLYEDSNNNLWIASAEGIGYLDESRMNYVVKSDFGFSNVFAVLEDKEKKLWFGDRKKGLMMLDPKTNKRSYFEHEINNKNSLSSNKVLSLYEDSLQRIWIGTEHGSLCIYDQKEKKFYHYVNNEVDSESLLFNSIYSIYEDRDKNIWLGCFGGIELLKHKKFLHIRANGLDKNSLSNNNVLCFQEDRNGIIWIGTDGGGLNKWDRKNGNFTHYRHDPKNLKSLGSDAILGVEEAGNGKLWVATWGGGLNLFDPEKNEAIRYMEESGNPRSLINNNLFGMYKDKNGGIWALTLYGLDYYDKTIDGFIHYNIAGTGIDDLIGGLYEDKEGNFWVGSFRGLYQLDRNTKKVTPFLHRDEDSTTISSNQIFSLKEDRKGNLWICTAAGINLYNKEKKNFTAFRKGDGLPTDGANGFIEDENGYFWISTGNGICKFNPETKKVRNFTISDGLQSNYFKLRSIYQLKSGEMLFGGENGFNIIEPGKIRENRIVPAVILTNFKIFNEQVPVGAKNSPLKEHISLCKEIELSYKQSVFSFDFAALNYKSSEKNKYAYILEGLEEKWNYVGNKRSATYTSLDPGTYYFRVKASNNDGFWNEEGTTLKIIVTPPYWATWWFRSLILISIIIILFTWYKVRVRNIHQQKVVLEEKVKQRTAEILAQKEELASQANQLLSQADKLQKANTELTLQREQIQELYTELKDSIRAAKVIQNSILPPMKLIKSHLPNSFILNRPKDAVGGDFYWFDVIDDKIVIAAVDCTGHGVSGAFMSIIGHHLLNHCILPHQKLIPSEILNRLNEQVIKELNQNNDEEQAVDGMDIALCIVDKKNFKLQFAGASSPVYIVRNQEILGLKGDKYPIGLSLEGEMNTFSNNEIDLEPDDLIYLFSDGYPDQIGGPKGEQKFLHSRFRNLLVNISQMEMDQQLRALDNNLNKWRKGMDQLDDVLVIGFKV